MKNTKVATTMFLALVLAGSLVAQTGTVSGTVKDESGKPLAGANIMVQGTSLGSASDEGGGYTIADVPAGSQTVVATYIGYVSSEQTVTVAAGSNTVDFTLEESSFLGRY